MDNIKITGKQVKEIVEGLPDNWEIVCVDKDGNEKPWDRCNCSYDSKNKKVKFMA